MALHIINGDLITKTTVERGETEKYPAYTIDEYYPTSEIKIDTAKRSDFKIFPFAKIFCYNEGANLACTCRKNESGKTETMIRYTDRARFDSEVYLIAVPFNGILQPVPENKYYRIHHATVLRSDSGASIEWGESRYTTVAYLVVSLNKLDMTRDKVDNVVIPFISKVSHKDEDNKRTYFTHTIEVYLNQDASCICTPDVLDPDPDPNYTPPDPNTERPRAFVLYEAPDDKPKPVYRSMAPENAEFLDLAKKERKGHKGKKGRKNRHNQEDD